MRTNNQLLNSARFPIHKDFNLISMPAVSLLPEEADQFLTYLEDQSVMKNFAKIMRINLPQKDIRAIGFGDGRFLYPAGEFDESKYKKTFTNDLIRVTTIEARGAFPIYDSDLEDVRGVTTSNQFTDKIMQLIAKQSANEIEEVCYMGNTGVTPNPFAVDDLRGELDGWRFIINNSQLGQTYYNNVSGAANVLLACEGGESGNAFNFAGKISERDTSAPYDWEHKYAKMQKNMPSQYKKGGLGKFVFLNNDLVTADYAIALSSRPTGVGDTNITGPETARYLKVPIFDVPLMPTNLGGAGADYGTIGGGDYTDCIMTARDNLIVAIQRDITIESERSAADQAVYIYYSIRFAVAIANVNAIVFTGCLEHEC